MTIKKCLNNKPSVCCLITVTLGYPAGYAVDRFELIEICIILQKIF